MSSRGAFTGDVLMSGYVDGRNSSRVLNPPGGKSSDIFGTGGGPHTSYVKPTASRTAAPDGGVPWATQAEAPSRAPEQAHAKRNESTVFRSPIVHKTTSEAAAEAAYRRGRSQVFSSSSPARGNGGCPWATDEPAQQRAAPVQQPQRYEQQQAPRAAAPTATYSRGAPASYSQEAPSITQSVNPGSRGTSTGDVLMSGHSGRNSSRVLQPPGGSSSIWFG
jgi:hypothetical protein